MLLSTKASLKAEVPLSFVGVISYSLPQPTFTFPHTKKTPQQQQEKMMPGLKAAGS